MPVAQQYNKNASALIYAPPMYFSHALIRLDGARFDAITFNDVFEHLPDVNGMAQILPDYLEPGGTVIVSLPVADGLISRMVRLVRDSA